MEAMQKWQMEITKNKDIRRKGLRRKENVRRQES